MTRTLSTILAFFWTCISFGQAGSIDPTFNPTDPGFGKGDGPNDAVNCAALLPDGKILVGGNFYMVNNQSRNVLARLNADGTLDPTFTSGAYGGPVYAIVRQPDGKIIIGGWFSSVSGISRNRIARLNADGSLDTSFDPGTGMNNIVWSVALQSDGKVLTSGIFTSVNGTPRYCIARLNTNGSLDTSFDPGTGTTGNLIDNVAVQPDGKILISGGFSFYNGTARKCIARLNTDGSLDNTFNPGVGPNGAIYSMAIQTDGKVVIGGTFQTYSGTARSGLARVNADGTLDLTFNPGTGVGTSAQAIKALAIATNGKVQAGGSFTTFNGIARSRVLRVNSDGLLDTSFDPGAGANEVVNDLVLQPDGKAVIVGNFGEYGGVFMNRYARIEANGALDASFSPGSGVNGGRVWRTVLQPDGKVLLAGEFRRVNNVPRERIARMNADGSLDLSFDPGTGANEGVSAIALQPDGKVLIGGTFTAVNGIARNRVARLNADGSLDAGFDPGTGPDAGVFDMVVQPDGKVLICGGFAAVSGSTRYYLARLNTTGALDASFDAGLNSATVGSGAAVALQPDGKVLLAGGSTVGRVKRFTGSGAADNTFSASETGMADNSNSWLTSIDPQPDGKVLVAGYFNMFNNQTRAGLVRLTATGSLDASFNAGWILDYCSDVLAQPDGKVLVCGTGGIHQFSSNGTYDGTLGSAVYGPLQSMALQPDGRVIIAGEFHSYNGTGRNRIARINGSAATVGTSLALRVLLGGPYDQGTLLMNDGLRSGALLPLAQPYDGLGFPVHAGGAAITAAPVLATTGPNAIVDWVRVEFRSAGNPSQAITVRHALLQRDGDVVAPANGTSNIQLNGLATGSYYVAIRHRDHLGVMTASAVNLSGSAVTVDFTLTTTATYGSSAQKQTGTKMLLWAGDATGNGVLKYTGSGNDRDPIILAVGGSTPNNTVSNVYDRRDTNLDGVIKYTGSGNDRDIILTNVGSTTPNNTRTQQLP